MHTMSRQVPFLLYQSKSGLNTSTKQLFQHLGVFHRAMKERYFCEAAELDNFIE